MTAFHVVVDYAGGVLSEYLFEDTVDDFEDFVFFSNWLCFQSGDPATISRVLLLNKNWGRTVIH